MPTRRKAQKARKRARKGSLSGIEHLTKMCYPGHMTRRISTTRAVGYVRVSTKRQGVSGLGLDAQQKAIADFCAANGLTLIKEYREVESGKNNSRPVLAQAIAQTKATKAVLLIAKLDRLARNVHFISGLMESVDFRACDYPDDDPFILHIRAAIAEDEARKISLRISEALQAAKRRGVKLGGSNPRCRNLTPQAQRKAARANAMKAREANAEATGIVTGLRSNGLTFEQIAQELDDRGLYTRTGCQYNAMTVWRLVERA